MKKIAFMYIITTLSFPALSNTHRLSEISKCPEKIFQNYKCNGPSRTLSDFSVEYRLSIRKANEEDKKELDSDIIFYESQGEKKNSSSYHKRVKTFIKFGLWSYSGVTSSCSKAALTTFSEKKDNWGGLDYQELETFSPSDTYTEDGKLGFTRTFVEIKKIYDKSFSKDHVKTVTHFCEPLNIPLSEEF